MLRPVTYVACVQEILCGIVCNLCCYTEGCVAMLEDTSLLLELVSLPERCTHTPTLVQAFRLLYRLVWFLNKNNKTKDTAGQTKNTDTTQLKSETGNNSTIGNREVVDTKDESPPRAIGNKSSAKTVGKKFSEKPNKSRTIENTNVDEAVMDTSGCTKHVTSGVTQRQNSNPTPPRPSYTNNSVAHHAYPDEEAKVEDISDISTNVEPRKVSAMSKNMGIVLHNSSLEQFLAFILEHNSNGEAAVITI